jgi:16S rRNA (uracil1498-N3)-methyltransferase
VRIIRIYQPGDYTQDQSLELTPSASQHVAIVLRMQVGDPLTLFCGDNREFLATIESIQKKRVWIHIHTVNFVNRESSRAIHLAQAISKGERMEFVMQKAVELGVVSITPLITTHCVVRLDAERLAKKQAQWQNIAISACEQSGRNQLPIIHSPRALDDFLQNCQSTHRFVLYPEAQKSWRDYDFFAGDISLIIGPEGGLSEEESTSALHHFFLPLQLGPRVLRTETAAITALSVLQAVSGDL